MPDTVSSIFPALSVRCRITERRIAEPGAIDAGLSVDYVAVMIEGSSSARLMIDRDALVANWRSLDRMSGNAACGAAVKADGYGLGAYAVVSALAGAGCRDFFVATWSEAIVLAPLGVSVSVLNGLRKEDMSVALALPDARPVLNTDKQVARWRGGAGGLCDVMIDTGMNRLGLSPTAAANGALNGLTVDILMSHLACADTDDPMNARQLARFQSLSDLPARRRSLANSAAIAFGQDYAFDLTRPGLALYGGIPRAEFARTIRQVVYPQAQVLQRRTIRAGDAVGYDATWTAPVDTEVAILGLGYADGYFRGFSDTGSAAGGAFRVIGRVSMDLVALDVMSRPQIAEGDWVSIDYALPEASAATAMSQYELLTGLSARYDREWTGADSGPVHGS